MYENGNQTEMPANKLTHRIAPVPKPGVRLHQGGNLTRAQKGLTGVKQDIY